MKLIATIAITCTRQ